MSEALASTSPDTGRSKHLAELALVFRHRHGTWADFGQFLKALFGETPSRGWIDRPMQHHPCICRHTLMDRHGSVLAAVVQDPQSYPMFDHERYTRPCFGMGSFDEGKNPGLIVHDVCKKAVQFLKSIGKGDPDEPSGRDFEYEPPQSSSPDVDFNQVVSDHNSDIDMLSEVDIENIIDTKRAIMPVRDTEDDGEYNDSFFDDEDTKAELVALTDSAGGDNHSVVGSSIGWSLELPEGYTSSQDSVTQLANRLSTKMRAHTLAFLWGFADQPGELRKQFRLLRSRSDLWVLHLCGCGLSLQGQDKVQNYGCTEKTHLILGGRELNDLHKSYHIVLGMSPASNYPTIVSAIRGNGESAAGVF